MSLDLDDETREQLGWGDGRDTDDRGVPMTPTFAQRVRRNEGSRIAPGDVDGRSKRNWRHKRQTRATTPDTAGVRSAEQAS